MTSGNKFRIDINVGRKIWKHRLNLIKEEKVLYLIGSLNIRLLTVISLPRKKSQWSIDPYLGRHHAVQFCIFTLDHHQFRLIWLDKCLCYPVITVLSKRACFEYSVLVVLLLFPFALRVAVFFQGCVEAFFC